MWPSSPEVDRSDLCQKYWMFCNDSETALYDSTHLNYLVLSRHYPELIHSNYIKHYNTGTSMAISPDTTSDGSSDELVSAEQRTTRPRRRPKKESSSQVELTVENSIKSRKLLEKMSDVFDKYVRKESKVCKPLLEIYTQGSDRNLPIKRFEGVIVSKIVSQLCGWNNYSGYWEHAFKKVGVVSCLGVKRSKTEECRALSRNLSHGLYNADVVDRDYIIQNCEALIDPKCISSYFPGILDTEDNDPNLDENSKRLHSAMRLVEKRLNTKVVEEDPELMQISVSLGQSASSAIKNAPGFKSLRTELIKEFVQIKWSKIGILLTIAYLTAGTWLYLVNNQEASLQWFHSALGSGMIVLLQGTAKTPSQFNRCTHIAVFILNSIGLHAVIGVFDHHGHWFIRWRGLIWSSLWITWLVPMLEYKLCGQYKYGTTFVAFLTFFGRVIDGTGGVIFVIFFENK